MLVDAYLPPGPPSGTVAAASRAAAIGFDGLFSYETSHSPFIPLALVAESVPSLDIGTGVAVAFPRSPMVTAQAAWDLADLSGGKFILGLGTQVKAHIKLRFSEEWVAPGPRMREYIEALRAIWRTFQHDEPLRFAGDRYRFGLMTPFFNPGPIEHPDIPVAVAGVGPYMSRLAGELCQGFFVHPFHTVDYLDRVVLANMAEGVSRAGRTLADVTRIASVFVVSGRDETRLAQRMRAVKQQIAFYASTPSYRVVLETNGWDFGPTLSAMSRRGEWEQMADVIPDEVVHAVAIVAPPDEIGSRMRERYGDRLQRIGIYAVGDTPLFDDETMSRVVADIRSPAAANR